MNPIVLVLGAAAVFVAVLMAMQFGYWAYKSREDAKDRELSRRLGTAADSELDADVFQLQVKDQLVETLGTLGKDLDQLIRQSGEATTVAATLQKMAIFGLIGMAFFLVMLKSPAAILGGLAFGGAPLLILYAKGTSRAKRLSDQLPDALDLMGRSLQAGHGLSDAMRLCAEEMELPVAAEFGRVYEEHNLGKDMRGCLENLCNRNPANFDLKIFVSSVLLQRETGGNLIEIIDNIAGTIRDRIVFHKKVGALTAEAKFSALILSGLPLAVGLMIRIMRPEYLVPLYTDPLGQKFLMTAVSLYVFGGFVMYKLSQVEA